MKLIILDKNWDNQEKALLKAYNFQDSIDKSQYALCKEDGIYVRFPGDAESKFQIDFLDGKFLFRLKTLSKTQPLFKALNVSEKPKIIDCTAGLGKDALTFAYFGCEVVAYEENEIVYLLLKDALERAFANAEFKNKIKGSLKLEFGKSQEAFKNSSEKFDCAYIDPMYPLEENKKALPKKEILFLRELLPETENLESILKTAIENTRARVVLKRPTKSEFIYRKPTHSFESKMVRFDLYISKPSS